MLKYTKSQQKKASAKKSFTLAEVLITLAVIGVVAAMSIPGLMSSTTEQELRTKVKKMYTVLNQAAKRVAIDQGGDLSNLSATEMKDAFKVILNIEKDCTQLTCKEGNDHNGEFANADSNPLVLSDGSAINFSSFETGDWRTETDEDGGIWCPEPKDAKIKYFRVHTDVTGLKDNTNQLPYSGEFDFWITNDGRVLPAGGCTQGRGGYAAGAYVVITNNPHKLKKDVSGLYPSGSYEREGLYNL